MLRRKFSPTGFHGTHANPLLRSWNTTLRSIIPLPNPAANPSSSAHPSNLEDYPKGTAVLALYPDTTSFYRATVVSAPLPGTGHGLGIRGGSGRADPGAKKEVYRLAFVDDGDNLSEVHKDSVVLVSGSRCSTIARSRYSDTAQYPGTQYPT
jgi:SAGA-associated factor 29